MLFIINETNIILNEVQSDYIFSTLELKEGHLFFSYLFMIEVLDAEDK